MERYCSLVPPWASICLGNLEQKHFEMGSWKEKYNHTGSSGGLGGGTQELNIYLE